MAHIKNVLISAYTAMNLGDDLLIIFLCNRYTHINFFLKCSKKYARPFKQISNLTILCTLPSNLIFDFQIQIGGSIFMQSSTKSITEKFEKDLYTRHKPDVPFQIIGANFGPYTSNEFFNLYNEYLSSVDRVCFRDIYSMELFKHKNIFYGADILFNYPLSKTKASKCILFSCIKKTQRSGLSQYNETNYFNTIAALVEKYVVLGYKIILAGFCKSEMDDISINMIYKLLSQKAKRRTKKINYSGNVTQFLKSFLSVEYVVATRFHASILAWNAGIPFLPISYNSKTNKAFESYEFKNKMTDINNINILRFEDVDANRTSAITNQSTSLRNSALEHFYDIDIRFNKG